MTATIMVPNGERVTMLFWTRASACVSMITTVPLPSCVKSSDRLHPLLRCGQRPLGNLFGILLVRRNITEIYFVDMINDLYIARDFTFNTLICFALHLALVVKFLSSLFHVIDGSANELNLLVLLDSLIDKHILFT